MSVNRFRLEGRVALVTGASRGIGAAIAKTFAQAGATVLLNYRSNAEAAQKVLEEVKRYSPASELFCFDIGNAPETEKAFEEIQKKFPAIHILVANAGISRESLIPRASAEHFQEVINTNLMGTINCVRLVSRGMMKARYGRIICVGSVIGEMGNKGQSAYAASKAALFGFAKSVALELASRNVTCNVLCPGFIETEMTKELDEATRALYLERIPSGRFATAEELAYSVQFLASEEAGYLTGATLDVNGGLLMR